MPAIRDDLYLDSSKTGGPPVIGSHAAYHRNILEIDNLITDLQEYSSLFTPQHKTTLRRLVGEDTPSVMTVDEIQKQFELVKKIRDQIIDPSGKLLDGVEVKVIAALVSSLSSLISLFLKNQEKIDHMKEVSHLKVSVIEAVSGLDADTQSKFFAKLDELSSRK